MIDRSLGVAFLAAAATVAFGSMLTEREFLPYDDEPNFLSDDVRSWRSESLQEQLKWALTTTRGHVYEPVAWIFKSLQFNVVGKTSATSFAVTSFFAHLLTTSLLALLSFHLLSRRSTLHRILRQQKHTEAIGDDYCLAVASLLAAALWR
jgi:hypothetical protein